MSAFEFKHRGIQRFTEEEMNKIKKLPIVRYEEVDDINNSEKHEWVQVQSFTESSGKYGRTMYCLKTGIRRSQTMGEFYGGGVVD